MQGQWLEGLNASNEERLSMGRSGAETDVAMEPYYTTLERCRKLIGQYFGHV
ncbi:hypothetical protein BAOM_2292 [Peribacillus asahii]|uniref:Uncharacterized protein n=1 Tax=Peribacillus asahii TaxID=228899 RepID=A0A3T0KRQ1_9BACI|nr:hypothetical protein BAOM_2292 [Peribacillus asahii]